MVLGKLNTVRVYNSFYHKTESRDKRKHSPVRRSSVLDGFHFHCVIMFCARVDFGRIRTFCVRAYTRRGYKFRQTDRTCVSTTGCHAHGNTHSITCSRWEIWENVIGLIASSEDYWLCGHSEWFIIIIFAVPVMHRSYDMAVKSIQLGQTCYAEKHRICEMFTVLKTPFLMNHINCYRLILYAENASRVPLDSSSNETVGYHRYNYSLRILTTVFRVLCLLQNMIVMDFWLKFFFFLYHFDERVKFSMRFLNY